LVTIVEKSEKHKRPSEVFTGLFLVAVAGLIIPGAIMFGKYWWPHVEPHVRRAREGLWWTFAPKRTVVEYERDAEGRIIRTKEWKEPV